jgi:hypothetical protein
MKNFITVGTRVAVAALFSLAAAGSVQAADCSFRPNAPDQHTVVRGDTLWGISGTFLEHPWCWPQVWGMNRDEIANPHWIYPGQIVYFDRKNGRLSLVKPGSGDGSEGLPTARLSPQVRTQGMGEGAIASIPAGAIEPFLTRPLIVDEGQMNGAPRVVAQQDGHVYLGAGDKLYVRGDLRGSTSFQVYRPGVPLRDPETGKIIAYEAVYLGSVALVAPARAGVDVHTFQVASSAQEIGVGDLLMPTPPTPLRNYVPHVPSRPVKGRVLGMNAGLSFAAQNQVVSINRGSVDGIDVGAVLNLYHFGETITDPGGRQGILGFGRTALKLPDEEVGNLFVFRVFKNVSYGLIMQATQPVQIGDVAASPE